jgi:membrane protease YdiL (CAAX protease family)
MNIRRSTAIELTAIGVAALLFVATFRVRASYVDFALAGAAVALIALSARRSTRLWLATAAEPFGPPHHRAAWLATAAFTAVALVVLTAIAAIVARGAPAVPTFGERITNWHMPIAMALYFPWALLQQYIFQHYLLGRLLHLLRPSAAIAITAIAFSCVHFPRWPVMALVLIAGALWSTIYYRTRTLLPLAASHAVLGSVLHYWVFGRDLLEVWLP